MAMALKNLLGLVCDPVAGLVEVPCVKRNVIGAVNAVSAADMALAGIESRVPVDQVIDCMGDVGRRLPVELRETALGGLAATPFGQSVKAKQEERRSQRTGADEDKEKDLPCKAGPSVLQKGRFRLFRLARTFWNQSLPSTNRETT